MSITPRGDHTEVLSVGGQELRLAVPNVATEVAYRNFLESRALHTLQVHAPRLGEKGYGKAVREWSRDCTVGIYEWGREEWAESLLSDDCFRELFYLLVSQAYPATFPREQIYSIFDEHRKEVEEKAMRLIFPNSLRASTPTPTPTPEGTTTAPTTPPQEDTPSPSTT